MSVVDSPQGIGAGICVRCGRSITHPGPDGECARCLVSFGFLAEDQEVERRSEGNQARLGPLRYAHFEVEVNADGFPAILGSGAMAVTYRARDTVLNSAVALKVISRKLAEDPIARARFLREARAAAQVQQPNIARVIHYGEQDGECFYAMELVHGETLEERVQRDGPLPLSLVLEVVEQTARGLAAGEACGVIHRDLKPSNLMTESDPSGQMLVKIIDYGIAKVMVSDPTLQTHAGFIGTPAFASPEQFNGPGQQQVDTRSDIYSLGLVFWYLLTGRTLFPGQSLQEVRAKQRGELPLEQLKAAHVPAQVVGLLRSMLAVDPEKRPQNARELLTLVHRSFIRFEPGALLRRKQLLTGVAALGLIITVVSLAIFGYQRAQSSSQLDRAIAVLPFENLSSNAEDYFFAIGIQDEILTKLATLADLKVIARTSAESYHSKPIDLRTVGRQLNVGRVLEGSLQRSGDKVRVNVQLIDTRTNTHLWASSYDRKLDDVFGVETEIANTIAEQLDAKLAQRISRERPTQIVAAYNAYLRGVGIEQSQSSGNLSYEDSATAYAEALQLDPNFALAWARLSIVRSFLYYHGVDPQVNSAAAAKEAADRAIALAPELGEAWLARGTYRWRALNDPGAALQAYREAEKRLPNSALVNEYMAYAERRLSRWREAEAHLNRAIELDPRNDRLWTNLASDILWPLGRAAEAHAAYDRALEISPNNEFVMALEAEQYQQEGRLNEAAKELARIPRDSTDKAVLIHRVDQAVLERNFDEALFWAKKATSSPSPGQPHNTQDIFAMVLEGYCQVWAGHNEEALTTFERVINEVAPGGVLRTPPILASELYLAVAYAALGDKSNAHEQARRGVVEYENDALLKPIAEAFQARALAQLGEVDAAIDALPHLLEVPAGIHPGELRFSPYWDPLRNDPRFQALLKNPPPVRY
jgi:serine/threonine protein kinase/Flp pilus assembly protein TadD